MKYKRKPKSLYIYCVSTGDTGKLRDKMNSIIERINLSRALGTNNSKKTEFKRRKK